MKNLFFLFILSFFVLSCGDNRERTYRYSSNYPYSATNYYNQYPVLQDVSIYPSQVWEGEYFTAELRYSDPDGDLQGYCVSLDGCGIITDWDCYDTFVSNNYSGIITESFISPPYCYWDSSYLIYFFVYDYYGNESNTVVRYISVW